MTARGIARTFQNIRLFANMTALDNVLIGMHSRLKSTPLGAVLRLPSVNREEREARARARELLDYVGLRGQGPVTAKNLAYGDQRRLEIARALASRAEAAAARRADRGHEPAGDGADDPLHRPAAPRPRPDDPAHRARHEGGDGHLRSGRRCSTTG